MIERWKEVVEVDVLSFNHGLEKVKCVVLEKILLYLDVMYILSDENRRSSEHVSIMIILK